MSQTIMEVKGTSTNLKATEHNHEKIWLDSNLIAAIV